MLSWIATHPLESAAAALLLAGSALVGYLVWYWSGPRDWDSYWGEDDE
jgi:hypothetical protein